MLVDDDHELLKTWPHCGELQRAWTVYWNSYYDLGFDPLVGRKLGGLLASAGVSDVRVDTIFYGAQTGQDLFEPVVDNLIGVLCGATGHLESSGRMKPGEMTAAVSAIEAWRQHSAACVWYSLPMATGIKTI